MPFKSQLRLINANKSVYIAPPNWRLMEYTRIVAVTGMPGLYEVLSSKSDGAIVRSLDDKTTKFVSARVHNLTHLESIEIYTVRDNVSLADVFMAMKNNGPSLPDVKDNKALKAYFEKVYPDMDFERVYASDMKKMVKWYEVLQQNEVDFTPAVPAQEGEEAPAAEATPAAEAAEPVTAEQPAVEEAPKPKRGRKKKTEE